MMHMNMIQNTYFAFRKKVMKKPSGCFNLRCFLIVFLGILFCLTVIRQCFDFLGYQWIPIMANFLHILALIFVIFGVVQLRPGFLCSFIIWAPLWLAWNSFLVCYFFNLGSLSRDSDFLTFFTGGANWWHGKTGCSTVYNESLHKRVIATCTIEYWHVELVQAFVQLFMTFIALLAVLVFLLNFSNNKLLRSATKTTIRVPHQPRVTMEPSEAVFTKPKFAPPLPAGYHSDTTGYLNASVDGSVANGVTYADIRNDRNSGRPVSNGYLPPEGSLERENLQQNGRVVGQDPIPGYRRNRNSSKRRTNSKRSSDSTESPTINVDGPPPGARISYIAPAQKSTSQESLESGGPPEYVRRGPRGTSLDRERRRGGQKDRRNSVPHRRRGQSSRSTETVSQVTARADEYRTSISSAPTWQNGTRPLSHSQLSSSQQSLSSNNPVGSHRGFKHFPTAGLARMVGNQVAQPSSPTASSSAVRYDPTYDHHHRGRGGSRINTDVPLRSSSPVNRNSTEDSGIPDNDPVTSFVSFDPESNTLIRYHDRNFRASANSAEQEPMRGMFQYPSVNPPGPGSRNPSDVPTIPIRYPPPTPTGQGHVQPQRPPPVPPLAPRVTQHRPKRRTPSPRPRHPAPPPPVDRSEQEQPSFESSSLLV